VEFSGRKFHRREDWTQPCSINAPTRRAPIPFRSLREGKLFLAETLPSTPAALSMATGGNPTREHFWLCTPASSHFTLRFDPTHGMLTVPLSERASPRFLTHAASTLDCLPKGCRWITQSQTLACSVCGLDTFRHTGWFLWLRTAGSTAQILSLAFRARSQKGMKSVCCREHLKTLIDHWLNQASLRLPPARNPPLPMAAIRL